MEVGEDFFREIEWKDWWVCEFSCVKQSRVSRQRFYRERKRARERRVPKTGGKMSPLFIGGTKGINLVQKSP